MADGTITIDGRKVPFEKGETIIKAAYKVGIDIPHYCWHPGLSAPANCRMCLVDVEPPPGRNRMMLNVLEYDPKVGDYVPAKKPKLQPACQMQCADGMVVHSDESDAVKRARASVQELLLLNHPVDCPICDQAGECNLQDYWLEHQRTGKRMKQEPVHKPKGVVFGETIVYDGERCIMCTRCVRVSAEVAKDPVLDMRQRGNRNEIFVAPGRELDHDYSLMTEHVCPVGALTSSHFRFKARVWFLRAGRTICQGCATGCNAYLDYDPRDNKPYRYRPRDNEKVNKYWMCDTGMLGYPEAYENRLLHAHIAGSDAPIPEAIDAARAALAPVVLTRSAETRSAETTAPRLAVVLSARHCLEDNFALGFVAKRHLGVDHVYEARRPHGEEDDILRHRDKNSNSAGVRKVCNTLDLGPPRAFSELLTEVTAGRVTHVLSLGSDIDVDDETAVAAALDTLEGFVAICTHRSVLSDAADVALPASSWAEVRGTYINAKGMSQRTDAVLEKYGDSYPGWQLAVALGRALGFAIPWRNRSDLEDAMLEAKAPAAAGSARAPVTRDAAAVVTADAPGE
ncbi:MAG: 2Fe-2S iron-sulfur cluster-binding protein [Myxococcota bacterium]